MTPLKAPFPEPFFGSGAVLLGLDAQRFRALLAEERYS